MNENLDDPNNHVPAISPDDDWDDLDADPNGSRSGLPPMRRDVKLPPKEALRPIVNRHGEKLVSPRIEENENDVERHSADRSPSDRVETSEPVTKVGREQRANAGGKRSAKIRSVTAEDNGMGGLIGVPEDESGSDRPDRLTERLPLPPAPTVRPNRVVNTIGAENKSSTDIRPQEPLIVKKAFASTQQTAESEAEEIERQRNHFVVGERGDWGMAAKGGTRWGWMAYSGLGVAFLIVLAVFLSHLIWDSNESKSDQSFFSTLEPEEEAAPDGKDDLEMLEFLTNGQVTAKSIFAKYATASSVGEFAGIIFNEEEVLALIEKDWRPTGASAGWAPDETAVWRVVEKNGFQGGRYGILEGSLPDFTSYFAFFQMDGAALKLDWKATTGYSSAAFSEMKKGAGDGQEIRASISLADFYTFALPEGEYRAYRVMASDGETNIWGYTAIGGEPDKEIKRLFERSEITGEVENEVRVILAMEKASDDSLPNQWLIKGLVRSSWLDEKAQ